MNSQLLFSAIVVAAIVLFLVSCGRRFRLVRLGRPANRTDGPIGRVWFMLLYAFGQVKVVSRAFGWNHFVLFWCFITLGLANADFVVQGVSGFGLKQALPDSVYHALILVFDIATVVTMAAICMAVSRRLFFPPKYIEAKSPDAFAILSLVFGLMVAYFGTHATELLLPGGAGESAFRPISAAISVLLQSMPESSIESLTTAFWWIHALILLSFLNYLPYSKHMHILTAVPNCFLRSRVQVNTLPAESFVDNDRFGVDAVDAFTWKDLFDSYSCTECGRCQDVCPAAATGKPLNPRLVIHEIKANLLANGPDMLKKMAPKVPLIGPKDGHGTISEESIWSCTSCGACMEVCPVFIEQMPKILQMRRNLVEMQSKMPEELITFFENSEQRSNPWGIAPGDRAKWFSQLDVKLFEPSMEYLFYVGCAGSFDARSRQVTFALTKIFNAAGISWGVLGKDEKCCGDSLRRLGNEFVFDKMARENVAQFKALGVKKIITECPHCLSTIKNDYKQFGLEVEVIHYAQLVQDLIASGKIKLDPKSDLGRIVFHDSCYLSRHNDVMAAPRSVLASATGHAPAEMKRHGKNSFCCGAGGGRMWMEENVGTRINNERVKEAIAEKAETVCVCCPYCLTMMEDGIKDLNAEATLKVRDVAEVVADRLVV